MIKSPIEIYIFLTMFGLLVGSFLNVVIYRLPLGLSVVKPRSSCPKCKKPISWYQNIPVLSYILLRGSCAECNTRISIRYPLVELVMGIIAFLLVPDFISLENLLIFFFYFSLAACFFTHFIIDIEHQILPDKINLFLLVITLWYVVIKLPFTFWLIGGLVGFCIPYGVTWLFYKIRGQIGLGGGDIKLFGILGMLLGPIGVVQNIFFSCSLGAVVGAFLIITKKMNKSSAMAFGPFIIIAAVLQIYFPSLFKLINPFYL